MFSLFKNTVANYIFMWGFFLLHVYVLLQSPVSTQAKTQMRTRMSSSRCPFSMARQFLAHPTALMATSLSTFDAVQSTARAHRHEMKMMTYRRFPQLQSLYGSPASGSAPVYYSGYSTSLYAQTIDTPTVSHDTHSPASSSAKKPKKKRATDSLEVIVLGLSHHNAKVEVREKLAIPEDQWSFASSQLCEYESISEAVVLSTCNRFELYLSGENQYEVMRDAMDFLLKRGGLDQITLRRNLFILSGEDAIWHLLRVSAGLDSLVVGEGQILSQVKKAYEKGLEAPLGRGGKVISRLLNTAVSAGKRVRSETGISKGAVSISSAAAEFSALKLKDTCEMSDIKQAQIVIIGAGKMARLLLIHLESQGVSKVTIVNRSRERSEALQGEFPNLTLNLQDMGAMWRCIQQADIVYPSTASTTTIIDPEPLSQAMEERLKGGKQGGIQFVDISVPRNVHPDCGALPNVHSFNVDDLKAVVERNTAKRKREMIEAEIILREEMSKYRVWQQSLGAIPTITKLQEKAELLRKEELQKAASKLQSLNSKDLEVVEKVTKGIVAKLLHGPMNHLRQQSEGDATVAIQQVQQAFQLKD